MLLFFFFQAEDGIRDWSVTGVQTCALPISSLPETKLPARSGPQRKRPRRVKAPSPAESRRSRGSARPPSKGRSEERRVGKECRSRWWQDQEKKKDNKGERER